MRALAGRLGTAPTAVYTFFDGKDALLQELAETELADLWVDCDPAIDWEEALGGWMRNFRKALLKSKWLEDLIALTCSSPAVLSGVEQVAKVLERAGLSRAKSALTAQNLLWTVLGFVMMEIDAGQPELAARVREAQRTPGFRAFTKHLAVDKFDSLYEITVENALAGVTSQTGTA